jgi:hypothetical protein
VPEEPSSERPSTPERAGETIHDVQRLVPREAALVAIFAWLACGSGLALPGTTRAQADPSAAQWQAAEALVRASITADGRTVLEITRQARRHMGTTFWARSTGADGPRGGVIAVRDGVARPIDDEARLRELMRTDQLLTRGRWTVDDLLWVTSSAGVRPPIAHDLIRTSDEHAWLLPGIARDGGVLRLVAYAFSGHSTPEPPNGEHVFVDRVTLTIDASYALSWNVEADLDLDGRGRPHS